MWDLDSAEAANIFRILDEDSVGRISIDDFLTGCFHLRGRANQLDLTLLMYENKLESERWGRFVSFVVEEFSGVNKAIFSLASRLNCVGSTGPINQRVESDANAPDAPRSTCYDAL